MVTFAADTTLIFVAFRSTALADGLVIFPNALRAVVWTFFAPDYLGRVVVDYCLARRTVLLTESRREEDKEEESN